MGFASVFHHGVRIPFNFDLGLPSVSQRVSAAKWSGVHSVHPPASRFCSGFSPLSSTAVFVTWYILVLASDEFLVAVYHCRRAHCVPISCSKGTDQEDDDISNTKTSHTHSSVNNRRESQGHETYTSSVSTVALWVGRCQLNMVLVLSSLFLLSSKSLALYQHSCYHL